MDIQMLSEIIRNICLPCAFILLIAWIMLLLTISAIIDWRSRASGDEDDEKEGK